MVNYDALAKDFARYRAGAITDVVLGFETVAQQLRPLDGKFVLDYGCGAGNFSRFLRNQGAIVTGVDLSKEMIALAEGNDAHGIRYFTLVHSGEVDMVWDGSMDAVAMNFVLAVLATRDEIDRVVREAYRVLKRGGILTILGANWDKANGKQFLTFSLDRVPVLTSGMKVSGTLKGETPIRIEDYYWSPSDHRAALAAAGFRVRAMVEPIAYEDGYAWVNETTTPPFVVWVAQKK